MAGPNPVQTFRTLLYGEDTQAGDGMISDFERPQVESAINAAIQQKDLFAIEEAFDFLARSPQAVVADSVRATMARQIAAGTGFDPAMVERLTKSLKRIDTITQAQKLLSDVIRREISDGSLTFDEWTNFFNRTVYPFWLITEEDGSAIKLATGATTLFLSTAVESGIGIEDKVLDHIGDLYKKIGISQALLARCKRLTASDLPKHQSSQRRTPAKPRSPTKPAEGPKSEPTPPPTPFSRPKSKGD